MSGEADTGGGRLAFAGTILLALVILVLPVALLLVLAELPTRTLAIVTAFAVLIRGYPAWSARTLNRLADAPDPMVQREIARILPERLAAEPDPVVRREAERMVRERFQRS